MSVFGARSYLIRGIHFPIVLLVYKLKGSTLYLKSGENSTIYFLFTQYSAPAIVFQESFLCSPFLKQLLQHPVEYTVGMMQNATTK